MTSDLRPTIQLLVCRTPDSGWNAERDLAGDDQIEIANDTVPIKELTASVARYAPDAVVLQTGSPALCLPDLRRAAPASRSTALLVCAAVVTRATVYAALAAGARR